MNYILAQLAENHKALEARSSDYEHLQRYRYVKSQGQVGVPNRWFSTCPQDNPVYGLSFRLTLVKLSLGSRSMNLCSGSIAALAGLPATFTVMVCSG